MAHINYSDNKHKDLIWSIIGTKLKTPGSLCKARWMLLKEQFIKALKNKTISGQAAVVPRKWIYEDSMNFLIPFLREHEINSNIASSDVIVISDDEDISQVNNMVMEIEIGRETASSTLMQHLINSGNNESKKTTDVHLIDSFFHGLTATVKTFSPKYQLMAKKKLFNLVSDLELAQLQNNQMTPSTSNLTSDLGSNSSTSNLTSDLGSNSST
ncbi:uncharacterized protein LOC112682744, partial [Sipha flava]|uniref:Uncharacterized protein LOC112682744 n=1 Tax=Sipha flava TaxID=143950 RepID=A0A8B8FFV3_9HEMI